MRQVAPASSLRQSAPLAAYTTFASRGSKAKLSTTPPRWNIRQLSPASRVM